MASVCLEAEAALFYKALAADIDLTSMQPMDPNEAVANAVVKISQKGLFLGPNDVDPLAIRYQNEIEPLTE